MVPLPLLLACCVFLALEVLWPQSVPHAARCDRCIHLPSGAAIHQMGVTEALRAPIIAIDCGLAEDTSQTGGPDAFADAFAMVTLPLLLLSQFQCSFQREGSMWQCIELCLQLWHSSTDTLIVSFFRHLKLCSMQFIIQRPAQLLFSGTCTGDALKIPKESSSRGCSVCSTGRNACSTGIR